MICFILRDEFHSIQDILKKIFHSTQRKSSSLFKSISYGLVRAKMGTMLSPTFTIVFVLDILRGDIVFIQYMYRDNFLEKISHSRGSLSKNLFQLRDRFLSPPTRKERMFQEREKKNWLFATPCETVNCFNKKYTQLLRIL